MIFSSMIFLWVFLPTTLIIYYLLNIIIINKKVCIAIKNIFLLIASLLFYAWGNLYFFIIMLYCIVINYTGGLIISIIDSKKKKTRSFILFLIIFLNILMLFLFKYFNMTIMIIEQVIANNNLKDVFLNIFSMKRTGSLRIIEIALPIGISFFTFQAMSYVIDVYYKKAKAQKYISDFGLYVALFPQLIAGPIVRYADIARQINNRVESTDKFSKGIKRFCYGLGKKVILANTFALIVDNIYKYDLNNIGRIIAIMFTVSYMLQIYYDFSGYSDMAIGIGLMFGFEFKENFDYPYTSFSITEFWRRWHISLSNWFKEYIYIPLGGNRKGIIRTCLNLLIVFFLTGIWHGANFTFIIWGMIYGVIIVVEKLFLYKILQWNKIKIINLAYVIFVVSMLFILFRCDTVFDAIAIYKQFFIIDSKYSFMSLMSMKYILALVFGILFTGIFQRIFIKIYKRINKLTIVNMIDSLIQFSILAYSVLCIVDGTYNPFIYFQF